MTTTIDRCPLCESPMSTRLPGRCTNADCGRWEGPDAARPSMTRAEDEAWAALRSQLDTLDRVAKGSAHRAEMLRGWARDNAPAIEAVLRASAPLCGCTFDASEPSGVCPRCHHREHGTSGCRAIRASAPLDVAKVTDEAWAALVAALGHPNARFVVEKHRLIIEAVIRASAPLDEPRRRIEDLRDRSMRQGTWGIEYGDDRFYDDVMAALGETKP